MNWSVEEVTKLAPKASTLSRGKKLATTSKWLSTGRHETAIWGECKGSGAKPYRTIIDLNGPAYNCSCPSREFPCKHALGLFLLTAQAPDTVNSTTAPDWTNKWLAGRAPKAAAPPKEKTPEEIQKAKETKAANQAKRLQLMLTGLDHLDIWLADLLREGLASVEKQTEAFWSNIAARMVDAKLRGIANMIRSIPKTIERTPDWPEAICYLLGDIHLMAKGLRRLDELPQDLQDELKGRAGVDVKKDDLFNDYKGVKDEWIVLGQISDWSEMDPQLRYRRVWLRGSNTEEYALLLDFYHTFSGSTFSNNYRVGTKFEGVLVYYPGQTKLRAAQKIKGPEEVGFQKINGAESYTDFFAQYAKATAKNPWLDSYPVYFSGVTPLVKDKAFWLMDKEQKLLPTSLAPEKSWKLLAISGGDPIDLFGEWANNLFLPMAVIHQNQIIQLCN